MLLMYSYFTFLDRVEVILVHRAHHLLSKSTLILWVRRNRLSVSSTVSISFKRQRDNIQGSKLRNEIGPKPIKQKANLGASCNLRVRRIPAFAEYCFIAQAERLDDCHTDGVRLHRRRQNLGDQTR